MPKVLLAVGILLLAAVAPLAHAGALLFESFDARTLNTAEKQLLQAALTASGDYDGGLDGAWGATSQDAIAAYAGREFEDAPLNLYAATLVMGLQADIEAHGWQPQDFPDLGISLALPLADLGPPLPEDGGTRWWSETGSLAVLMLRFDFTQATIWHDSAAEANARPLALRTVRRDALMVTAGRLDDGRWFFTRSDLVAGAWSTVHLVSDADQAAALHLIGASIRPGPPLDWTLPPGGRLERIVTATLGLLEEIGDPAAGAAPIPTLPPLVAALPPDGETEASGTGFFIGARVLLTAGHVVAGCGRVALADGTELTPIAADPDLDVAAFAAPVPAASWLAPARGDRLRLGARVHAAGFPYYSITGTSLHLTGGNVSATAGVDDDRRFFSFTAPVQPGNSGGPLIDADGTVLGLVVSRLNERYIAEATGALPQNVNYALGNVELLAFLERNGIASAPGGLGGFDMDAGVPDGFEAAVVPVLCR